MTPENIPSTVRVDQKVEKVEGGEVVAVKIGTWVNVYNFGAVGSFGAEAVAAPPRAALPYKGLDSYEFGDRHIFFGRETLARELSAQILGHTTTALIGKSGAGKTSLIHASLIPALGRGGDIAALSVRDYAAPVTRVREGLQHSPGLSRPLPQDESLAAMTASFTAQTGRRLVIFFDQLERLLALPSSQQEEFARQIAAAQVPNQEDGVHLVFVLRPESRPAAADLQARVRDANLLSNIQPVPGLNEEEVKEAILKPLKTDGGIDLAAVPEDGEHGLVKQWIWPQLAALSHAQNEQGQALVDPALLQIVCSRLYELAQTAVKDTGRQPQLTIALFRESGQAAGLLRSDLNNRLAGLASGDELTWLRRVLYTMAVSDSPQSCPAAYLARALDKDEARVATWLSQLASVGLVEAGEAAYALTPVYLAGEIRKWFQDEEDQEAADKALARALADWDYQHIPTERRRLGRIRQSLDSLRPEPREYALLLRSAVAYEADPGFWAGKLAQDARSVEVCGKLEEGDDADPTVAEVADVLGLQKPGRKSLTLAEGAVSAAEADVRIASALVLSVLASKEGGGKVQERLQPYLTATSAGGRLAAVKALAWIRFSGLDRGWPRLSVEPLVIALVLCLRLWANRIRVASVAASALAGTSLVGLVLPLVHLAVALSVGLPNPALELVSSLAVGVVLGGIVGAFYGVADVIPAPGRAGAGVVLRPLGIVLGAALANALLIGASLGGWAGWPPLLIGALAASGFAATNEWGLACFPGSARRRLLLGLIGFALTVAVAAIVTTWRLSAPELGFRDRLPWQFAGGLNTLIFSGFPREISACIAYIVWNTVSGGIIGLGLAGGLTVGHGLAAELERARYV